MVSFAGGHDDGGVVVEGLDGAEVEVLAVGRFGAELPDDAGVLGAEDGAVGAGGPGDAVADVVDAAEVGGGVGVVELPLGGRSCGGGGEESEEKEGPWHVEREHTPGLKPLFFAGERDPSLKARGT